MIKRVFFILFSFSLLFSSTTKEKIAGANRDLKASQSEQKNLNDKIEGIATQILNEKKSIDKRQGEIDELSALVVNLKDKFADEQKELDRLNSQNQALLSLQEDIENKIVSIISKELSFDVLNDESGVKSEQSVIGNELFSAFSKTISLELSNLVKTYENNQKLIKDQDRKIDIIKTNMQYYSNKKESLSHKQKEQEKMLSSLEDNRKTYINRLTKINDEQDELRKTLEKLKIIDDREEREKAEKIERERITRLEAQKKKEAEKAKKLAKKDNKTEEIKEDTSQEVVEIEDPKVAKLNQKVKQYGVSYQESRVKKYTGAKTISPLDSAYVKRKFGNYNDPVYNIKIFNESIVLGSNSDTQVKSVLAGKIVFANETSVLDKVVIIEHTGGIHTIYANMTQIAPTIKVGLSVKKGYVIGRINSDLTFEVTQKNYHINPLDLISLK